MINAIGVFCVKFIDCTVLRGALLAPTELSNPFEGGSQGDHRIPPSEELASTSLSQSLWNHLLGAGTEVM